MKQRSFKRKDAERRRRKDIFLGANVLVCLLVLASNILGQEISVKDKLQTGDFPLVYKNQTAEIFVSNDDFKVVKIAANDFVSDVEMVSDQRLKVRNEASNLSKNVVIISTLGKNPLVESLIKSQKLDISAIQNKWESFLIATVKNPFPDVENALVIVGSDRRGTAFGVYEMSQKIGVSPWVWWADALPEKRKTLVISKGRFVSKEPSVKYRGIFLNDEDWGLQPWAAKNFEPETGNIGPKTYAKIFELLLRLKANTCWSAMHEVTKPFNEINGNAQTADDYAIVMGSSHAEPMLRNNVGEWKDAKEKYNFVSNETGVTNYWEDRIKTNGKFENIYTLGMRGIHDSPIQGTRSQAERIPVLEKIIATQRNLLAKYVDKRVENVPQIFCPYKEVLADYRAGLRVPDDVTIVFPDDNFGYIRAFPDTTEQKRRGGFGVYYHISYLGRPLSYLWLNSTPPSLIFEEMSKAYANGMREFWMLNVGDIKPAEIGIEFFMQMAYDARKWNVSNQNQFLNAWAKREFGEKDSAEIAYLMDKYYRLGFQRKPEHLQWFIPKETPRKSDLTTEEIGLRLEDYATLRRRAETVYAQMSPLKKDAFYELVLYPIRAAQLANERFFAVEIAGELKAKNNAQAIVWARKSIAADAEIQRETKYFNEQLNGGKWRYIMSPEMNEGQWTSMRALSPKISEKDYEIDASKPDTTNNYQEWLAPDKFPKNFKGFMHWLGVVSIEAEHFTNKNDKNGFGWQTISGLGKTGDSVSVFPQIAQTFSGDAPSLEYRFYVSKPLEYYATFFLIPTQPLTANNGLRFAFSVDGSEPQIITIDKDTEVSSAKWANNILNETTVGKARIKLEKGTHILKISAVDTGVVLDKIVLSEGELPTSYFAPRETIVR
jgi:hypothetical protein